MFASKWVHALTCLHGTSWGQLPSYSVFPLMKIYFEFMASQGGHTKLLSGSDWKNRPSVTGQTNRKNISEKAGPNARAAVWHCLLYGSGTEPKQGLWAHPTWMGGLRWIPATNSGDPGAFLVSVAFSWWHVLLKPSQRAALLATPLLMKHAM